MSGTQQAADGVDEEDSVESMDESGSADGNASEGSEEDSSGDGSSEEEDQEGSSDERKGQGATKKVLAGSFALPAGKSSCQVEAPDNETEATLSRPCCTPSD
jgi:hypothetical protein